MQHDLLGRRVGPAEDNPAQALAVLHHLGYWNIGDPIPWAPRTVCKGRHNGCRCDTCEQARLPRGPHAPAAPIRQPWEAIPMSAKRAA